MIFNARISVRIGIFLAIIMILVSITTPEDAFAAKKKKVKKIVFQNAQNSVKVIKKGKRINLKVSVTPKTASKKMTYRSSNPKIVKVSQKGSVRGVKKGTAYVTAYAKDGSNKKKRVKVIVGTPVKKIKITGQNVIMNGSSVKLTATVTPKSASYKKLKWTSSNKKVATVNSKGKVTYKKEGTATITAYAQDGSKVKGKFKVITASIKKSEASFIAHRGYSSKAPENSIASFNLALKKGFTGIECDVWEVEKTPVEEELEDDKDGATSDSDEETTTSAVETDFVIFHDATLDRMTAESGNVKDKTFEELTSIKLTGGNEIASYKTETIPSLEEYLNLMVKYPDIQPVIEIKSYTESSTRNMISIQGTQKILDMLDERGLTGKTLIISFGKKALSQFKDLNPDIQTQFLTKNKGESLNSDIEWAYQNKMDGVSVYYSSIDKNAVKKIHELGMKAGIYTINSQLNAYKFIRLMGVDYISSNKILWR